MTRISICLPSLYEDACHNAIQMLNAYTRNDHEIIVVSPFRVQGDNVVWIEDPLHHGSAASQAIAGEHAKGDFLLAFSDDRGLAPGWDDQMVLTYYSRLARHPSPDPNAPLCLGPRHMTNPFVGTVFGMHYPYFPFIHRGEVWYDPKLHSSFGDCDVGLQVWNLGGVCEWGPPLVSILPNEYRRPGGVNPAQRESDQDYFLDKWKGYTAGWDLSDLRNWNIDVDPDLLGCTEPTLRPGDGIIEGERASEVAFKLAQASPPYLEGTTAINLVRFRGKFYGVPQALGELDLSVDANRQTRGIKEFDSRQAAVDYYFPPN